MARTVFCSYLKRDAEGLDAVPHPGELGQRIYGNISKEAWGSWLERLTMIINENGLNTADPRALEVIENHMVGFLFDEGDLGGIPQGFRTGGKK